MEYWNVGILGFKTDFRLPAFQSGRKSKPELFHGTLLK